MRLFRDEKNEWLGVHIKMLENAFGRRLGQSRPMDNRRLGASYRVITTNFPRHGPLLTLLVEFF